MKGYMFAIFCVLVLARPCYAIKQCVLGSGRYTSVTFPPMSVSNGATDWQVGLPTAGGYTETVMRGLAVCMSSAYCSGPTRSSNVYENTQCCCQAISPAVSMWVPVDLREYYSAYEYVPDNQKAGVCNTYCAAACTNLAIKRQGFNIFDTLGAYK